MKRSYVMTKVKIEIGKGVVLSQDDCIRNLIPSEVIFEKENGNIKSTINYLQQILDNLIKPVLHLRELRSSIDKLKNQLAILKSGEVTTPVKHVIMLSRQLYTAEDNYRLAQATQNSDSQQLSATEQVIISNVDMAIKTCTENGIKIKRMTLNDILSTEKGAWALYMALLKDDWFDVASSAKSINSLKYTENDDIMRV